MSAKPRSETRDGMRIDWDVADRDGRRPRAAADVFRPVKDGRYPVILSYGPYAKGLAFQDGYPSAWERMATQHPDVTAGSSNLYQSWEVVDPEKWVPHDYACVRVDSRGCGCSPGFIDHFSPRETKDFYDCIEWAGVQPWSNGKVGLNGISYYGINQWHVATLQPPHLAAMCIWEGAADWYRDMTHHGGILCTFWENWYDMQVKTVQYGAGERGKRSRVHGELVCGPETLSEKQLAKNRSDFGNEICDRPLDDDYHKARSPIWAKVTTPMSVGRQLGRPAAAPARQFRRLCARGLQAEMARGARHRALDAFLHGLRPQAAAQASSTIFCTARRTAGTRSRACGCRSATSTNSSSALRTEWPLKRTKWTKLYLDPVELGLGSKRARKNVTLSFDAMGDGVTFLTAPVTEDTEITGPLRAQALRLVLDQRRRPVRRVARVRA